MEQSRTTLSNWFLAIYLIEGSENRIKNSKLAEALEVKVDTARLIRKKFLAARRFRSLNIGEHNDYVSIFPSPIADKSGLLADALAEILRVRA